MNKKILNKLVENSLTRESLDPKKVERIAGILSRKELKSYITALKKWEMKKEIVIISPVALKKDTEKELKKMFKNKTIINKIDPTLLVGIRVIDNDLVYNLTLKDTLDNFTNFQKEI